MKVIYKDETYPYVAPTINTLGNVYESKGYHEKAIECLTQCLEMMKLICKDESHQDIASTLKKTLGTFITRKVNTIRQ